MKPSTRQRIHPRSPASVASSELLAPPDARQARRPGWATPAALAAWLGLNLLMLAPDFRGAALVGSRPVSPALALLLAIPPSLVMTAAGWAAFRLTRRHTVARRGFVRSVAVHAAAALGFALLITGVRRAERLLLEGYGPRFGPEHDAGELAAVVVVYAVLAAVAHALEYARRYRERQLAELRLQASLARAELERAAAELRVLKLQLNPHFLFNSLHAVSALVHEAPAAAERMVVRLADLLRQASTRVGTQEVPLDEEVRTLEPFLEVEGIRLGGRLRVEWDVEDAARGAHVPHMVLQPLVENAIKHGLAGREGGGRVEISARRSGPWLELAVRDDGVGLAAAAADRAREGAGIGTANTRARLAQLYGGQHALEIAPAEGGGTRVSLRIPWHEEPWPSRALEASAAEVRAAGAAPPAGRRRWLWRAAAAVLFLFLWRRAAGGMYGMTVLPGRVVGAAEAAVCGALNAAVLTLLFAAPFVLARRAPVVSGAGGRPLRRHARAALLAALAVTLERNACSLLWGTPASVLATPYALGAMAVEVLLGMGVFAALSLVAHALEYARRARAREAAGLRLQASLARAGLERASAELRGLRMQVNPGFLFTALEAVASRVHHAPGEAERMVVRLAELLRRTAAGGAEEGQEVPLEEEARALEPFLEVERIRLGGRLEVEWEVDDEALDALVPHLLLQPLVLAAIGSGGSEGGGGARVAVEARRREDWLEVEVRGGGTAGAPDGYAAEETRSRLARLYGGRWGVEVSPAEEGGTRTVVRLPWHDEPWPSPAVGAAAGEEVPSP